MAAVGRLRVSERDFERQVLDLAKLTGWRTAHFRPALNARGDWRTPVAGDGKGFPDLVLVKGERILLAELKSQRGVVRPEQREWLEAFRKTRAEVYVWRPTDWPEIEQVLKGGVS